MTETDKIDDMPEKDKESSEEEEKKTNQDWQYYFAPAQATKLITKRCISYSVFIGLYYTVQLAGCIGTVNFYSDTDRHISCTEG